MRLIYTWQDLVLLRQAKALPEDYLKYLEEMFLEVKDLLEYGKPKESFSLHNHGGIIVLERGDNAKDLSAVGLNPQDGGLLGTAPETTNKVVLSSIVLYETLVVHNNEYACFYIVPENLDDEVETWLRWQAGTD
ncbi:MAG TPA: hypothetical protein VFC74_05905 [Oscillospiraceae bacterium]|jgi:hypothetical protein|nr:hypothetical protein [Oscillospiraceae bacterium]